MKRVRPAGVAGAFYPGNARELTDELTGYLDSAPVQTNHPVAIITPHAGTIYSGPVAASAYAVLRSCSAEIQRVVLVGPAHRTAFDGLALPDCDAVMTPLGEVMIDAEGVNAIKGLPGVVVLDKAHDKEHSLEVQLPFLQLVLRHFTLVPLAAGRCEPETVSRVFETLARPDTVFVISTDLSHYLDHKSAKERDRRTVDAIERMEYQNLQGTDACGFVGVRGFLHYAQAHQLTIRAVDVRNSGDTAGDKNRVVGYASFVAVRG